MPGAPSGAPKRGALRRLAPYSFIAIPAAFLATYFIMSNMDAYGTGMLTSTILLCCFGLVIVVGGIVAIVSSLGDLRAAKQSGDRRAYSKERDSLGWATIGVLMIAAPTFFYLVPAACDLFDGPQTRTVTSCSYDQDIVSSYRIPRNTFSIRTQSRDISRLSGIMQPLYQACVLNPDKTPLTIDVYMHSMVLEDVRLS